MTVADERERERRKARANFLDGAWVKLGRGNVKFQSQGRWFARVKWDRDIDAFGVEVVGMDADFRFLSPFVYKSKMQAMGAAFDAVEPPAGLPIGAWYDAHTAIERRTYVRLDEAGEWVAVTLADPNDYQSKTDNNAVPAGKVRDGTVPPWATATDIDHVATLPMPDGRDGYGPCG